MRRLAAALTLTVLATSATALTGTAAAKPRPDDRVRSQHQRIVDYWTPARLSSATPRDLVVAGEAPTQAKPGNGYGRDRVMAGVWQDPDAPVARTTGKVFFTIAGDPFSCSASAVAAPGVDLVLTAGHCVFEPGDPADGTGTFADYFVFIPGFEGGFVPGNSDSTETYDLWTATSVFTTAGWRGGVYADDVGFAVVTNGDGKSLAGTLGDLPVMALPSEDHVDEGQTVSAFGYPSARNYKGRQLGYCQGTLERGGPGAFALPCQLTGGASGGPWYSGAGGTGEVVSVNSFLLQGDNRVYGPAFDDDEEALLAEAADGTCADTENCATGLAQSPPDPDAD